MLFFTVFFHFLFFIFLRPNVSANLGIFYRIFNRICLRPNVSGNLVESTGGGEDQHALRGAIADGGDRGEPAQDALPVPGGLQVRAQQVRVGGGQEDAGQQAHQHHHHAEDLHRAQGGRAQVKILLVSLFSLIRGGRIRTAF